MILVDLDNPGWFAFVDMIIGFNRTAKQKDAPDEADAPRMQTAKESA